MRGGSRLGPVRPGDMTEVVLVAISLTGLLVQAALLVRGLSGRF
jgi:hypothetical protein